MPISTGRNNILYTISQRTTPIIVSSLRKIHYSDRLLVLLRQ